jgi:transcriptional regulator with XRE-family HTH domain
VTIAGVERITVHAAMLAMGEDLRAQRIARGMTQEEVAFLAEVAVHTYSSLERGYSAAGGVANPTIATLIRILDALGIAAPRIREFKSALATK